MRPSSRKRAFRVEQESQAAAPAGTNSAAPDVNSIFERGSEPAICRARRNGRMPARQGVVEQWIEDRCEIDHRAVVSSSIAYDSYARWAEDEIGWICACS
jgi:hypothetical protein